MADWDNTPPVARDLSAPGDNTPPTDIAVGGTPTNTPAIPIGAGNTPLINMPASFQPAFVELTGGGPALDTVMATAADIGKILQGTVAGELKSYRVAAGTDAADLPGVVRCGNFDAVLNAVVFVQC